MAAALVSFQLHRFHRARQRMPLANLDFKSIFTEDSKGPIRTHVHVETGGLISSRDGNYLQNVRETNQNSCLPPPPPNKQPSAEMHTVQLTSSQQSSDEHLIFGKSRNEKPQTQLKASQNNLACS